MSMITRIYIFPLLKRFQFLVNRFKQMDIEYVEAKIKKEGKILTYYCLKFKISITRIYIFSLLKRF